MNIFGCSRTSLRARNCAALAFTLSASLSLFAQEAGPPTENKTKPTDHSQMDHSHMDHSHMDHSQMKGAGAQDMSGMQGMPGMNSGDSMNSAGTFLMRESSGTAFQPSAWPMPMLMNEVG